MSDHQLLFLGCGSSVGVPVSLCTCEVCHSSDTHNQRLRSSVYIEMDQKRLLIDVGPDFRQQALKYDINQLDGVLLTHSHYDHVGGLNDLKPYSFFIDNSLPILLSKETALDIQQRYDYLFYKRLFQLEVLRGAYGETVFNGIKIGYGTYYQSGMPVNGFRMGSLAYLTDVRQYDSSIFEQFKGVKTLIISALRFTSSDIHLTVDEAIAFSKRLGVEQTWLTHLSHDLDYEKSNAYLPKNVRMAYDGLKINF
jgi:phosphoribosyl 1,2-cyclic phosphate phosphodiesterase